MSSLFEQIPEAYDFYMLANYGDLSEQEFSRYYPKAAMFVSTMTMGKSETVTDKKLIDRVWFATFAVMDEMYAAAQNDGAGPVLSESNDGVSVTYAASKDSRTTEERQRQAASLYLSGTGLLYRGVR